MATLKKVVLVTLAAVVGLVSAFARIAYAQTLPDPIMVLPSGEEVSEEELQKVEGEGLLWIIEILFRLLLGGAIVGWVTYQQTGDPWFSAVSGIAAMTCAILFMMPTPY